MSFKYKPVTQSILCLIFLMGVATMHHQSGQEYKKYVIYESDIPVTLKSCKSQSLKDLF